MRMIIGITLFVKPNHLFAMWADIYIYLYLIHASHFQQIYQIQLFPWDVQCSFMVPIFFKMCITGDKYLTSKGNVCTRWCHQMETFSASLALCEGIPPVTGGSPHKGQWSGALMFSLICVWTNGWASNRDAGDLGCHCAHNGVTVLSALSVQRMIYALPLQLPDCIRYVMLLPVFIEFELIPPSAAYMRQWTGSVFFQLMVCHLLDTKPSSEPMLKYC